MDGYRQNNDVDAGGQPHLPPADTMVHVLSGHTPFGSLQAWVDGVIILLPPNGNEYLVGARRVEGNGDHGDMNGYGDDAYRGGGFGAVPASDDEIARLEKATVGDTREAECVVCMEGFEEGDEIRKMPCSHGFHESCIFKWLQVSRLCPHCRFALSPKE